MVDQQSRIEIAGPVSEFVGRGGEKLAAALDAFGIEVAGRLAIDAGASTGGFTDCLLQRGAAGVIAVDVGYGQLDWKIQSDPRVDIRDRTNFRWMTGDDIPGLADVLVADLSFISLTLVAGVVESLTADSADIVLLVKPQFEVGKNEVPRGGVVRDPAAHHRAIAKVIEAYATVGMNAAGLIPSPIEGAKGNREFLLWLRRDGPGLADQDLEQAVGR